MSQPPPFRYYRVYFGRTEPLQKDIKKIKKRDKGNKTAKNGVSEHARQEIPTLVVLFIRKKKHAEEEKILLKFIP